MSRRTWFFDAALAVLLALIGRGLLGSFADYAATHDLDYFDDSEYQNDSLHERAGRHAAEWAPLYRLWARLLHLLTDDSLLVFHLNAYVLAISVSLLLFVLLRAYDVRPVLSFSAAVAWLVSAANLDIGPRVAEFCLLPMLAGLIAARALRSDPWRWSWLCACALLCSYVRPEFFYSLVLMLGVAAWRASRVRPVRTWLVAMAVPLVALIVIASLGQLPIGGSRATMAMKQHVLLSLMAWNGLSMENWQHSRELLAAYPSLDHGLMSFVIHDPMVFLHHALTNAALFFSPVATAGLRPAQFLLDAAPSLSLLAITLPFVLALPRIRLESPPSAHRDAAYALTIFALPSMVLCFVIYPRLHYLQLPLLAMIVLVMLATGRRNDSHVAAGLLATGLLVLVWTVWPRVATAPKPAPTPCQDTVRYLRKQDLPPAYGILDDSGMLHFHLPAAGRSFQKYEVRPPLQDWLVAHQIDLVVITGRGEREGQGGDTTWSDFLNDAPRYGYSCSWFAPGQRTLCRATRYKPQ